MSAIASYLLSLGKKTAAALRRVHLVLKINTIDSRKIKGEMIRRLELFSLLSPSE